MFSEFGLFGTIQFIQYFFLIFPQTNKVLTSSTNLKHPIHGKYIATTVFSEFFVLQNKRRFRFDWC